MVEGPTPRCPQQQVVLQRLKLFLHDCWSNTRGGEVGFLGQPRAERIGLTRSPPSLTQPSELFGPIAKAG